ncbi:membrane bound O-acyl transferase family-domain-containing protein [Xylaria sp. FL1777]|nr:membrane bound O-acyl transferase family-domain-containing protein [Xylaria sp. FL1777]
MDSMLASQPKPQLKVPSASILPHIALYVVQLIALASPPSRYRSPVFAVIILGLGIYAHIYPHFTNDVAIAQPFTIAWSYYLGTLAKLLFSGRGGPEARFWRIDGPKQEALRYRPFGWQKIRWAFSLIANQRGVRWNHEVKNVHPSETRDKARFLALQTWKIVKYILIADLLFSLNRRLFFTRADGFAGMLDSHSISLRHPSWGWSFAKALTFGATPYFMLSMQYAQLALVTVALGISRPEDWPPPFGSIGDVTTVRLFWGKYWHQQLRHMLTSYTDAFVDALGIRRGTNWSSYTTLYLAFLFSGTFHALSQRQMPCPVDVSDSERVVGFFLFFVWQAAAITVEDFVQWSWGRYTKERGLSRNIFISRVVGYIWVTWCIWTSLPLAGDTFLRMRLGEESFLPFSLTGPYVDKFVPVPP